MLYIKKQVEVEAFEYGNGYTPEWFEKEIKSGNAMEYIDNNRYERYCYIKNENGIFRVDVGNFIIKDENKSLHTMTKEIFEDVYTVVHHHDDRSW